MPNQNDPSPSELRHLTEMKKSVVRRCEELNFEIKEPMDALMFLEPYLFQLNQSTNGGGMTEYLLTTKRIERRWDVWSCAAILVGWIDQELLRKSFTLGLLDDDEMGKRMAQEEANSCNRNGSEDSTVNAILMQLVSYLDHNVRATSRCLDQVSAEDALLAALYFMKRQGLAVTGPINETDKRHWQFSSVAYEMLRLTIWDVSEDKVTRLSSAMGLAMIKDPDDWLKVREAFFDEYCAVASKVNVVAAWREVGTMMVHFAKKTIAFIGHEEAGGWLFTITRKGEKFGFERTKPGEARHFTLVPFTDGEPAMVVSAQELEHIPENHATHS